MRYVFIQYTIYKMKIYDFHLRQIVEELRDVQVENFSNLYDSIAEKFRNSPKTLV